MPLIIQSALHIGRFPCEFHQLRIENIREKNSKKQNLNLLRAGNYLRSIYVALGIISRDGLKDTGGCVWVACANTPSFCLRDLSVLMGGECGWSWNQCPADTGMTMLTIHFLDLIGSTYWSCEEESYQPSKSLLPCIWWSRSNVWHGIWYALNTSFFCPRPHDTSFFHIFLDLIFSLHERS